MKTYKQKSIKKYKIKKDTSLEQIGYYRNGGKYIPIYADGGFNAALPGILQTGAGIGLLATGAGTAPGIGMIASGLGKIIYDKNTYQKQLKEQQLKEQQSQPEFQPMPYVKHGGRYENKIEVEGNELRTKNGRITENFYGPSHENGGILTTGNQEDIFISEKEAERYINSEQRDRDAIDNMLVINQVKKETEEDIFRKGGIYIKPSKRGSLHRYLRVPKGSKIPSGILKIKSTDTPAIKKKKQFAINSRYWSKKEDGGYDFNNSEVSELSEFKNGGKWIQKAVSEMRTDKPCTGAKFGSSSCPSGSKRYNLAKTFRAMANSRENGGLCFNCGGITKTVKRMNDGGLSQWLFNTRSKFIPKAQDGWFNNPDYFETSETNEDNNMGPSLTGYEDIYNIALTPQEARNKQILDYQRSQFTLPTRNTDYSVPGSNKYSTVPETSTEFPLRQVLGTAATYAPVAYNLIAGLSKPNIEPVIPNKEDPKVRELLSQRIDPAYGFRQIDISALNQRKALNQSGLSQGQYLSLADQNAANAFKVKGDYAFQTENYNKELALKEAEGLANLGERNRQATAISRGQTLRNEYNKAQYIPTALGQLSYLVQSERNTSRKSAAYNILQASISEIRANGKARGENIEETERKVKAEQDNYRDTASVEYQSGINYFLPHRKNITTFQQ